MAFCQFTENNLRYHAGLLSSDIFAFELDNSALGKSIDVVDSEVILSRNISLSLPSLLSPPIDINEVKVKLSDYGDFVEHSLAIRTQDDCCSLQETMDLDFVEIQNYQGNNPSSHPTSSSPIDINEVKVSLPPRLTGTGDSWSNQHPQKDEFEEYLLNGIPIGQSIKVLLHSQFFPYVCHKYNSKEIAYEKINEVLGIGGDEATYLERKERLDKKLKKSDFLPCFLKGKMRWQDVPLSNEENIWLTEFAKYMSANERIYRKSTQEAYLQAASFIFKKCHLHPDGAFIGASDLVREFNWDLEASKKRFQLFWKRFVILKRVSYYVPKAKKYGYVRVSRLPGFKKRQKGWKKSLNSSEWIKELQEQGFEIDCEIEFAG